MKKTLAGIGGVAMILGGVLSLPDLLNENADMISYNVGYNIAIIGFIIGGGYLIYYAFKREPKKPETIESK